MNKDNIIISVSNLKKSYSKLEVLKGISLDIHQNEVISIKHINKGNICFLIKDLLFAFRQTHSIIFP